MKNNTCAKFSKAQPSQMNNLDFSGLLAFRLRLERSIYYVISASVHLGALGVLELPMERSDDLIVLLQKDTHAWPHLTLFLIFVRLPISSKTNAPTAKKTRASKQQKSWKSRITSTSKHIHEQDIQKDSVWKGSTLWNQQPLLQFQFFFQRPRPPETKAKWKLE